MQTPYRIIFSLFLCCTGSGSFAQQPPAPANAQAQAASSPQLPPQSPDVVIRTEKKLVLVDTVVTDKKGNYIHGMTQKDFRVWEDGKEQDIESFSAESDPASPLNNQKHYLVLFFDTTSMQTADQIYARKAALQFLDSNGGPNRLTAIVNFTGSLQIAQNFTNDSDRLKQVVNGVKFSSVSSNPEFASLGSPQLGRAAADFGARDVLLGLRTLAKNLGTVPGRKTLIFMSSGFLLNLELRSELTAVIDVCNHANVAIYPIDVRGLVAENVRCPHQSEFGCAETGEVALVKAAYFAQHGSGGGGGGHAGGGGTATGGGGARGGTGGTTSGGKAGGRNNGTLGGTRTGSYGQNYNPLTQPRSILPLLPNVTGPQEVLYALASGTGGFVIVDTNDLLGGFQKIGNELNEYYVLGYSPAKDDAEGSCHQLKVKAEHNGGTVVRARSGYCTAKPLDLLAGTATERSLEQRVFAPGTGTVAASMQTPFFYTSPNTARVDVAMDIPSDSLQFEKEKGKLHSEVNVLGIAYANDGTVAARFSDTLKLSFDNKKEVEAFQEKPLHYDKQFDVASGSYLFKVAFASGGENFGKLQGPLIVDPYDSKKFGISSVALSTSAHQVSSLDVGLDAALLEDQKPLVSQGVELPPAGSYTFDKAQRVGVYVEIYEPLLLGDAIPKVGLQMIIADRKTNQQKVDTGMMNMANYFHTGNSVIPVALLLPVDKLGPGLYRANLKAMDTAGSTSIVRSVDFEVR